MKGRGYVLRRIMRRAMRHAHLLGCQDPLMFKLVPALVTAMGAAFPELGRAESLLTETFRLEEERFKVTLDRGLKLLEEETDQLAAGQALPGDIAFRLYDTYGFPLDLTEDILKGQGRSVDNAVFDAAMDAQRAAARKAWSGSGEAATDEVWFDIRDQNGATEFLAMTPKQPKGRWSPLSWTGSRSTRPRWGWKPRWWSTRRRSMANPVARWGMPVNCGLSMARGSK